MWICLLPAALATDTWTTVRTGVDLLHRTTSDPQDIYAVRVDLTVPNVGLHASADSDGVERHTTVTNFARNADVLVALNGDWSDGDTPVGLAISDGSMWHSHITDDSVGGQWGYFACTATKDCTISAEVPLDTAWWFTTPTSASYRYYQAIGANGQLLVVDGISQTGCYDTAQNPRSAICLQADGTTLWLFAIDGRSGSANGMTCDETRTLMQEFDCWDAAMLDGGGSTALVVDGDLKNNPSDGSPRTVSNFLGIVYSDTVDPACTVASGFWCDGSVISSCQGGRPIASGDCAYYGASCEEDGDFAYCVDYRCPGGDGQAHTCLSDTILSGCSDGAYSEGDCGVFGLACGEDAAGASCMDPRCEAGPHSGFCTSAGWYAACTDGAYAEQDCPSAGLECDASRGCVTPGSEDSGDSGDSGSVDTSPADTGRDHDDEHAGKPGEATSLGDAGACGCGTTGAGSVGWLVIGLGLMAGRRRR